jgi:isoquinoline 1-oxidoreductase beta subunit
MSPGLSRRDFLGTIVAGSAAGSFVLGFSIPFDAQAQAAGPTPEINAWVVVHADERVVIRIARTEMGQGTLTGLAQLVAEELECDWARVSTEYPTPGQSLARKRPWGSFETGGSEGIRRSHESVRKGGAAARLMLMQAAANEWGVPVSGCHVAAGVIAHSSSMRRTTYGKVAAAAARLTPPTEIALKDPKDWKIAGQRMARLDTVDKTNGGQVYGTDLQWPGMLNAAIRDCPVFGGKLKQFDGAAVAAMPGVKRVLAVGETAVAVVADTWWRAKRALDALPIEWDLGPHAKVQQSDIAALLATGLDAPQAMVGNSQGNAREAIAGAARKLEATYAFPYQHHAAMEVLNATARFTPAHGRVAERCEVWTATQDGEEALAATAAAAGLPPAQCEVYKLHLGGSFGRRVALHDWVRQAVLIAKQVPGVAVKLIWSREEDMAHGQYHPITQCRLAAGLDAGGELTALHMRISGQSIRAGMNPQAMRGGHDASVFQGLNAAGSQSMLGYGFPALQIEHAMRNPHVPPGYWRGVNLNQNTFYLECFIDEIAHASQQDPLALRRKLMARHPKHLAVLNAAAERAGWGRPAPDISGRKVFRGLAQAQGFASYVAACAEVSVGADGDLTIHRIVAAIDPGHAVNPQQIEAQVEGSFAFGLSAALFGECTVKDGRVEQLNFDTYPVMLMNQMPKVETVLMPSGGFWGGVGEPTIAVAAPAVLNGVFAATGLRIRELPLRRHRLRGQPASK